MEPVDFSALEPEVQGFHRAGDIDCEHNIDALGTHHLLGIDPLGPAHGDDQKCDAERMEPIGEESQEEPCASAPAKALSRSSVAVICWRVASSGARSGARNQ